MRSSEPTPPGSGVRWRPGPVAVGVGALVAVTAAFARDPLRDAATGAAVPIATLERPLSFVLGAPLFGVWDTLGLLTLSQHYALFVTLVALYLSWRTRVRRRARERSLSGPMPLGTRVVREVRSALVALVALLAVYLGGMLVPRPMASLAVSAPHVVVVDFHSHTNHSHDGWRFFGAARNRGWHRAGGFHAAYVTDHYTWEGVDEAAAMNPARAGDGLVSLEGAEIRVFDRPTNILGDRRRYLPALDTDSVFMDADMMRVTLAAAGGAGVAAADSDAAGEPDAMAADTAGASTAPEGARETLPPPTLLYTMPGSLDQVVPRTPTDPVGVVGIEINDGSPRGLEQTRAERDEILGLADSADLAIVSASNLHGWGRTVTAWSLLTMPGWRELSPTQLGEQIEGTIHRDGRDAVQVVERWRPYHDQSPVRVAMTLPLIAVDHFRALDWAERTSWLVWLLFGSAIWSALRNRAADRRRSRGL